MRSCSAERRAGDQVGSRAWTGRRAQSLEEAGGAALGSPSRCATGGTVAGTVAGRRVRLATGSRRKEWDGAPGP